MTSIRNTKVMNIKKIVIAIIAIILIVVSSLILLQASKGSGKTSIVAIINGDPIYVKEFRERLFQQQIPVQQYFKDKYGTNAGSNFWNSSFEGENTLGKAKDLALNECVKIKVEQQLGQEKGLIKDLGYTTFLKELEKENKRRKKAVENNEVIYGPIEYQKNVYFEYIRSNMELKLKEILEDKEIQVTEENIIEYYEKTKDRLYRKEGSIKIQKIYVTYMDENREFSGEQRKEALKKIEQVKRRVDEEENIESILEASEKGEALKVNNKEQLFNETTAKQDAQSTSEIKTIAKSTPVGKTSSIMEENYTFYFIKCVEKEPDGYKPFEEAKENVKIKYIDEKYEQLINGLAKAAKVRINSTVYDSIKME